MDHISTIWIYYTIVENRQQTTCLIYLCINWGSIKKQMAQTSITLIHGGTNKGTNFKDIRRIYGKHKLYCSPSWPRDSMVVTSPRSKTYRQRTLRIVLKKGLQREAAILRQPNREELWGKNTHISLSFYSSPTSRWAPH